MLLQPSPLGKLNPSVAFGATSPGSGGSFILLRPPLKKRKNKDKNAKKSYQKNDIKNKVIFAGGKDLLHGFEA